MVIDVIFVVSLVGMLVCVIASFVMKRPRYLSLLLVGMFFMVLGIVIGRLLSNTWLSIPFMAIALVIMIFSAFKMSKNTKQ